MIFAIGFQNRREYFLEETNGLDADDLFDAINQTTM
jgi:hypothetical protein